MRDFDAKQLEEQYRLLSEGALSNAAGQSNVQLNPPASQSNPVADILEKYPMKNKAWMFHRDTNRFSADVSELDDLGEITDPWLRVIRNDTLKAIRDRENEITHWIANTSVNRVPIELIVYND